MHKNGHFVVSHTRFKVDYVHVWDEADIETYLEQGLSLRMSAPGTSPSLIRPDSILGRSNKS